MPDENPSPMLALARQLEAATNNPGQLPPASDALHSRILAATRKLLTGLETPESQLMHLAKAVCTRCSFISGAMTKSASPWHTGCCAPLCASDCSSASTRGHPPPRTWRTAAALMSHSSVGDGVADELNVMEVPTTNWARQSVSCERWQPLASSLSSARAFTPILYNRKLCARPNIVPLSRACAWFHSCLTGFPMAACIANRSITGLRLPRS